MLSQSLINEIKQIDKEYISEDYQILIYEELHKKIINDFIEMNLITEQGEAPTLATAAPAPAAPTNIADTSAKAAGDANFVKDLTELIGFATYGLEQAAKNKGMEAFKAYETQIRTLNTDIKDANLILKVYTPQQLNDPNFKLNPQDMQKLRACYDSILKNTPYMGVFLIMGKRKGELPQQYGKLMARNTDVAKMITHLDNMINTAA